MGQWIMYDLSDTVFGPSECMCEQPFTRIMRNVCILQSSCQMARSLIQVSNSMNGKSTADQGQPQSQRHQPTQQQQQLIGHSFISYNPNGPLMDLLQQQQPEQLRPRWIRSSPAHDTFCAKGLLYDSARPVCIITTSWWRQRYYSSSNPGDGSGASHLLFPSSKTCSAEAELDGTVSSAAGLSMYEPDPVPGLQAALNAAVERASMKRRWSDQQRQLLLVGWSQQRTAQHPLQQTISGLNLHQLIQQITDHATSAMIQSAGQAVEEDHLQHLQQQQSEQQASQKPLQQQTVQQQKGHARYRYGCCQEHQDMEVQDREELQQPEGSQQLPNSHFTHDARTQPALFSSPDSLQHDQGPRRRWKLQHQQQQQPQQKNSDTPRKAGPASPNGIGAVDQSPCCNKLAQRALDSTSASASASAGGPAGKLQADASDAQHPFVSAADPFSRIVDYVTDVAGQTPTCQLPAASTAPADCLAQVEQVCLALEVARVQLLQQAAEVAAAALCGPPECKAAGDPPATLDVAIANDIAASGLPSDADTAADAAVATEKPQTAQPLACCTTAVCSTTRACTEVRVAAEQERCPHHAAADTTATADPLHVPQIPTGSNSTFRHGAIDCCNLGSEEGELVSETRGRTGTAAASPSSPQGQLGTSRSCRTSGNSTSRCRKSSSSSESSSRNSSSARSSSKNSSKYNSRIENSESSGRNKSSNKTAASSSRSRSRSDSRITNSRSSKSRSNSRSGSKSNSRSNRHRIHSRSRGSSSSRSEEKITHRPHKSSRSRSVSYSSSSRRRNRSNSDSRSTSRSSSRARSGRDRSSSAKSRGRGKARRYRKDVRSWYSRSSSRSRSRLSSRSRSRSASYSSRDRSFSRRDAWHDTYSRSRSNDQRGRSSSRPRESSRSQSNSRSLPVHQQQMRYSYNTSDENGAIQQQEHATRGRTRHRASNNSPPKLRSASACAAAADTGALLGRLDLADLSSTEIDELRSAALLHMYAEAVLYQPPQATKGQRLCMRGGLLYQLELACEPP